MFCNSENVLSLLDYQPLVEDSPDIYRILTALSFNHSSVIFYIVIAMLTDIVAVVKF